MGLRGRHQPAALIDNTYVSGGANPGLFRVVAVNGSAAAAQLGILASDTTNVNLAEVSATTPMQGRP